MKLNKHLLNSFFLILMIAACSSIALKDRLNVSSEQQNIILTAEQKATPEGKKILVTGRQMIENKVILPGGCWDYIHEIYNRAGYPNLPTKREDVFKSVSTGPYANINLFRLGDFLYFINHSYKNFEHSAIFIDWLDNKQALMLSYAGENRHQPARYFPYDLSSVFRVIRAKR
ncbi:hypothetical protein PN36_14810 [Candidatus Thiomargarita nelsonii]|uniref:NlpC/P60 domain-containing protein n=1 Tax=Candidatus Thiomargarita nelsonii TaxID=1003181 RepID=A0A0A6P8C3_9GAMM|nr:hypothetical protein PN36_14810 [Candidatus Thiomargarita nelsonii]